MTLPQPPNSITFYTDSMQRYYYEGVFNYYKSVLGGFENLATGHIKTLNSEYQFESDDFYHNSENDFTAGTRDIVLSPFNWFLK